MPVADTENLLRGDDEASSAPGLNRPGWLWLTYILFGAAFLGRRGIRNPRVVGCVLAIRAHATYFQNSEIAPRTRSTLQVTRNRSKDGQAQDRNRGLDYSLSLERGNPVLSRWLLQVGAQLIPQGERHQSNEQCDRQQCDYRVVEMTDDGDAIWDRIDWS